LARIIGPMLHTKGKSSGFLKNVSVMLGHDFPELQKPIVYFTELADALDALDVHYQINISSGRGFEYYTGMIFQIYSCGELVAGGGRYDALIPLLGGSDIPASGFAIYVDKIMGLSGIARSQWQAEERIAIQPEPTGSSLKTAFDIVKVLHQEGYIAEIVTSGARQNANWLLEIQETGWRFRLHNVRTDSHYEVATVEEVLARLKL